MPEIAWLLAALILLSVLVAATFFAYRKYASGKAKKDYGLRYPLHLAVLKEDRSEVERLLEGGVERSGLDDKGNTPQHWAVFGGNHDIVALLLKQGAEVNAMAADGVSPLWRAEDFGLESIIELLRDHGGRSICC